MRRPTTTWRRRATSTSPCQWNVDKNFTIRGGVNNMFDRDPPLVSSTAGAFPAIAGPAIGNGNTYPQAYDTLGRNFFVNITAKF